MALDWKVKAFTVILVFFILALLISALKKPKEKEFTSGFKRPSHAYRGKNSEGPKPAA